jgi:type IV pilus assembly protein PilP
MRTRRPPRRSLHTPSGALLLGAVLLVAAACGDSAPPPQPQQPAQPQPQQPAQAQPAGPAAGAPKAEADRKPHPELELTEKDFVEGSNSRDPFRSFLNQFAVQKKRVKDDQRNILLKRYALDELRLIAVVTGTETRAMFRDPTGLGVTVKRGDFISKNAGKVKQILADKVVVEIEETAEDKNTYVDRIIELHPKEQGEGGEGEGSESP